MGKLLLTTLLLTVSFTCFSQNKGTIKGTITDAEMLGEPLLFAHVSLKSTTHAIQTNFHGNFEMSDVTPGDYTLFVQYPGYDSLEIPVSIEEDQITRIDQSMQAKKINLHSVVQTEAISSTNNTESLSSLNK